MEFREQLRETQGRRSKQILVKYALPATTVHTCLHTHGHAHTHTRVRNISRFAHPLHLRRAKPQLLRVGVLRTNNRVTINQPAEPRTEFTTVCRAWSDGPVFIIFKNNTEKGNAITKP